MFVHRSMLYLLVFLIKIFKVTCQGTSLCFVIDDTRSMYDDIQQVNDEIDAIMDIVLHEKSSQISNIVLVTFNDPDVKLRITTNDTQELKKALSQVRPHNYFNTDCPEMALTGVQLALENSLPGSYIYVFTDASAKDYMKKDEIVQLSQMKQSQISFVLTGSCRNPNSPLFQAYYDISTATSGLAFRVRKSAVQDVLRTLHETIKGNKSVLTARMVPPDIYTNISFTIDRQIKYAIIFVSGQRVYLNIDGPRNKDEQIMWTKHVRVVKLIDPIPGDYVAIVAGSSATSVVVVGRTDFFLKHGFSNSTPESFNDTQLQLVADTVTHLSILVMAPEGSVTLKSALIMDLDENVIRELPLTKISPNFYATKAFVSPSDTFKIAVNGNEAETGNFIRRFCKIPVTPKQLKNEDNKSMGLQMGRVPTVEILEGTSVNVTSGSDVTLTCNVIAFPSPEISWKNDSGFLVPSQNSTSQNKYEFVSYLKISDVSKDAKYYCHASNSLGSNFTAIDIKIKSPFIIEKVPEGTTNITYGTEHTLICNVTSNQPYHIGWFHVNQLTGQAEQVVSSDIYTLSSDGKKLKILSMNDNLAGKYTCKANLIEDPDNKREFSTYVTTDKLVPPVIVPGSETIKVGKHKPAVITCKISEGVPKPEISWKYKAAESVSDNYELVAGSGAKLHIPSVELHDEGSYRCVAVNSQGRDEQTVAELVVLKAPLVTIKEGSDLTVPYGSGLTLTCKITAIPEPVVIWTDEKNNTLPVLMTGFKNDFEYTYTANNMKRSGTYECHAENNEGEDRRSVQVTVQPPFTVISRPPTNITVPNGNLVSLSCDITSHLPMKISWNFTTQTAVEGRQLNSSGPYRLSSDDKELNITSMDAKSVGAYTCKAFLIDDPDVSQSFTADVNIGGEVPPEIDAKLHKITVNEDTLAVIPCAILKGQPIPTISWQIKAPGSTSYLDILTSGQEIRIEKTALINTGNYKCIAENVAGRDEQVVAELEVLKAPALMIVEGTSMEVKYGSNLSLTCKVTANPKPTITWMDDAGKSIPAESSAAKSDFEYIHVITRTNVMTSGKYFCNANNSRGSDLRSIQVSVSSPIKFHSHPPELIIAPYGSETSLLCNATSKLPIKIQWYYVNDSMSEKKEIENSMPYSVLMNGKILNINFTDIGLEGQYTCQASLLEDEDEHIEFTIKVELGALESPDITGDGHKKVRVGVPVTIKCRIIKGVPEPKISWQFMATDENKFKDINNTGDELQISNIQVNDSGYYKCIARNSKGSDEHVISLAVEEPAKITSEEFTVYGGLEGDMALRIPCDVIGQPKPAIKWRVEGAYVTPGKKYAIDNGSLIIRNPEQSDTNLYTCKATNAAGSDSKTFKVVVTDTLTDYGTLHYVYLIEGQSQELSCEFPRSDKSSTMWFVNKNYSGFNKTIFYLENVQEENEGNYSCHVSDIRDSFTVTYVVDVGYSPIFTSPQDNTIVDWDGNTDNLLNCEVEAKPRANIIWTLNGKPLPGSDTMELNVFKQGNYTCKVSNVHGTIQRDFEVKASVCLIDRYIKDVRRLPLLLNQDLTWPDYLISGQYFILKPGDKIILSCHNLEQSPNTFRKFPSRSEIEAFCDSGDTFTVDGSPYQLSDLLCENEIRPAVVKTNKTCLTETSELIDVGYNLNIFLEAYEVCFDYARNLPLYTRVLMFKDNNVPSAFSEWYHYPGIGLERKEAYTCNTTFSSCCYAKTQLVNAQDFSFGVVQNSTFIDPLNAVPYWRPCDSNRINWNDLEDSVRSHLDISFNSVVWSGLHSLEKKNGSIVPRYLWKVIKESESDSIALVYVNDPAPTEADIKCVNICGSENSWLLSVDRYTYCCNLQDFIKAFELPGYIFGEIPEASLAFRAFFQKYSSKRRYKTSSIKFME